MFKSSFEISFVGWKCPFYLILKPIFRFRHKPAHCSNRKVRIQKKLQEKSETAMRTVSSRAFKRAPTQGVLPLDPKSINSSFHSIWLSLARNYRVLMISSMGLILQFCFLNKWKKSRLQLKKMIGGYADSRGMCVLAKRHVSTLNHYKTRNLSHFWSVLKWIELEMNGMDLGSKGQTPRVGARLKALDEAVLMAASDFSCNFFHFPRPRIWTMWAIWDRVIGAKGCCG